METLETLDCRVRPATTAAQARKNYAKVHHGVPAPIEYKDAAPRYEDMTEAERRDLAARLVAARQRLARQGVL
jgi:hypothetical protein